MKNKTITRILTLTRTLNTKERKNKAVLWNQYNKPVGIWGKPVELYLKSLAVFKYFTREGEQVLKQPYPY